MSEAIPPVDIVVSFDTTGSMFPCLTQVRRKVSDLVDRLFAEVPNIRIGIIAHSDYCDEGRPYVIKIFDLSDDKNAICNFVERVEAGAGGDAPECYELALHEARNLHWRADSTRALVMIGDDEPHGPTYPLNKKKLDWKNELRVLQEMKVQVYGVHAMAAYRQHSRPFWQAMGEMTSGYYLTLDQFNEIRNILMAICYHQTGNNTLLTHFEEEISNARQMTRSMSKTFYTLTGKEPEINAAPAADESSSSSGGYRRRSSGGSYASRFATTVSKADLDAYGDIKLEPVPPGRFQRLELETDQVIRAFVNENVGEGAFVKGAGYYQFGRKPVNVQSYKKVVLVDKDTGDMYSGDAARKMIGLPKGKNYRLKPSEVDLDNYWVFIQSTSVNRRLFGGDSFLYEVKEFVDPSEVVEDDD